MFIELPLTFTIGLVVITICIIIIAISVFLDSIVRFKYMKWDEEERKGGA